MAKLKRNPGRMSHRAERDAWTAHITGEKPRATAKYQNQRSGKYASKKEADVAMKLQALERRGKITDLKEQVRIELVPGRDGVRSVTYWADFTYDDEDGKYHVLDAKGVRTTAYKIKKRLAYLLLGITIEEV